MRWLALAILALIATQARAQTLRLPEFRQCVARASGGFELIRSTAAEPVPSFTSTSDLKLAVGKRASVETYLTRKGSGPWKFWVVHNPWSNLNTKRPFEFLGARSELVIGDASRMVPAIVGREVGENRIFEIDPAVLIASYPEQPTIDYVFHSIDVEGSRGGRKVLKAVFDLTRLRAVMSEVSALDRDVTEGRTICAQSSAPIAPIYEAIDPTAYRECRLESGNGEHLSVWWIGDGVRIMWQRRLSKWAYLNADRGMSAKDLEAALSQTATPEIPGLLGGQVPIALFPDWYGLMKLGKLKQKQQLLLGARFEGDWGRNEVEARTANSGLPDDVVLNAYRSKGDLTISILSPAGALLDRATLPANTIPDAEARLRRLLGDLAQRLSDPMSNCQTPYNIVVT
jgi:hypothetical protein